MTAFKKQYVLEGLCCGNCAAKIEREVSKLDGVSAANVDFASKILTMEFTGSVSLENITGQTISIAKKYDPDITVKENDLH